MAACHADPKNVLARFVPMCCNRIKKELSYYLEDSKGVCVCVFVHVCVGQEREMKENMCVIDLSR